MILLPITGPNTFGNFAEVQVLRNDDPKLYEEAEKADGLVFSPGPGWPVDAGKMEDMIRDFAGKKPILGICLGHQAIAEVFGGKLGLAPKVMHGKQSHISFEAPSVLYQGIEDGRPVMRYHSILIEEMPEGFEVTARSTDDQAIMGIQHKTLPNLWLPVPSREYRNARRLVFYSEFYREGL